MQIPTFLAKAHKVSLQAGQQVFTAGDPCRNFYYLLEGSVRVDLIARNGKSIMLYRFGAGETCILTTSCLLGGADYNAEAHVEEETIALAMPHHEFQSLLGTSEGFRKLVFGSFATRLASMMNRIDEVAFSPLDNRLAHRLLELSNEQGQVQATHEQLAADIGSAREVVSRRLGNWQKSSLIERYRGGLKIVSKKGLTEKMKFGD
ncbi:MAG: Crp/Fnr family transcriptional regulator [Rhizobiaceae bacterium]